MEVRRGSVQNCAAEERPGPALTPSSRSHTARPPVMYQWRHHDDIVFKRPLSQWGGAGHECVMTSWWWCGLGDSPAHSVTHNPPSRQSMSPPRPVTTAAPTWPHARPHAALNRGYKIRIIDVHWPRLQCKVLGIHLNSSLSQKMVLIARHRSFNPQYTPPWLTTAIRWAHNISVFFTPNKALAGV